MTIDESLTPSAKCETNTITELSSFKSYCTAEEGSISTQNMPIES